MQMYCVILLEIRANSFFLCAGRPIKNISGPSWTIAVKILALFPALNFNLLLSSNPNYCHWFHNPSKVPWQLNNQPINIHYPNSFYDFYIDQYSDLSRIMSSSWPAFITSSHQCTVNVPSQKFLLQSNLSSLF